MEGCFTFQWGGEGEGGGVCFSDGEGSSFKCVCVGEGQPMGDINFDGGGGRMGGRPLHAPPPALWETLIKIS